LIDPGIGVPTFGASEVIVTLWLGERFERGAEGGAGSRIEFPFDKNGSVGRVAEAKVALLGIAPLLVGDSLRIGAMPGVHRVVPEPARTGVLSHSQQGPLIKRFRTVGVADRLRVARNNGRVREPDASLPDRLDRFRKRGELLAEVHAVTRARRRHLGLVPHPVSGWDRTPLDRSLALFQLGCVLCY